jgi:hypothetical protein
LSDQPNTSTVRPPTAARIAGLVVANASLIAAGLVYMGWAYTDALWGHFQINPIDLGVGIPEYLLRSLSLFSPDVVIAAVTFIAVTAAWNLNLARLTATATKAAARLTGPVPQLARLGKVRRLDSRLVQICAGTAVTITALVLYWLAELGEFRGMYLILGLLGAGPLLMSRPARADSRGRFPYALAIIVATTCVLWAGSLYAYNLGVSAAENFVRELPLDPAVAVYSIQPLNLAGGPGVMVQHLSADSRYHYLYKGLRLLIYRSGTYYLLPEGWSSQADPTYVLDNNDDVTIDLSSAERPS